MGSQQHDDHHYGQGRSSHTRRNALCDQHLDNLRQHSLNEIVASQSDSRRRGGNTDRHRDSHGSSNQAFSNQPWHQNPNEVGRRANDSQFTLGPPFLNPWTNESNVRAHQTRAIQSHGYGTNGAPEPIYPWGPDDYDRYLDTKAGASDDRGNRGSRRREIAELDAAETARTRNSRSTQRRSSLTGLDGVETARTRGSSSNQRGPLRGSKKA